jgi:hypothetical protein
MSSADEFTPGQCMFTAYDALRGAAERFDAVGDRDLANRARALADKVAAEDPVLHARIWRALGPNGASGKRPDEIAIRLSILHELLYPALEAMRRRGTARQSGGWWRAVGEHAPDDQ